MADNTTLNAGTGGDVIATDDIAGVKYQRVKVTYGADGTATDVNTGAAALPAQGAAASGAAVAGNPVLVGGSDGTNARSLKVATDGTLLINGVQDSRTSGTITGAASVVGPVSVANRNVVTFSISGTYAGVSFVIEATDDGTNWFGLQSINNATGVASATWTPGTNASASYDAAVGGYTQVRLRATAWTSGTATVGINPQVFAYDPVVAALSQGTSAAGTAVSGNPVLMGGSDGTNARAVATDTAGRQTVVGGAASGAAVAGNPVLVAGSDGTNARSLLTRTTGAAVVNYPSRTQLQFYANAVASGATGTETAITLTKASDTSATTSAASFVITNGKTFRITSITFASRGNATATAQISTFALRINTAGAVTTASTPVVLQVATATPATSSAWDRFQVPLPDGGLEFVGNGTIQFGVTANAVFTTNAPTWFVFISGYEY